MNLYGPTIERPIPLTYDPDIYWIGGARHCEQMVSRVLMKYARDRGWALRQAAIELDYACQKQARELGWHTYHTEEAERTDDQYHYIRRTLYECPGFCELKVWRAPNAVHTLSLQPQGGTRIDLPLQRLMCRGEQARGVLHDGTLHVVLYNPPKTI